MKTQSLVHALVVDDDEISLKVTSRMLEKLGIVTEISSSGVDALQIMKRKRFDIIFLDCVMPHLDGLDVARQIRSLYGTGARIPIIAMSARSYDEYRESCLKAGMDDFLAKPLRMVSISLTLQKWLKHLPQELFNSVSQSEFPKLKESEKGEPDFDS